MTANGQTAAGVRLEVDGSGTATVDTGLPVLDRLIVRLAEVARFDLALEIQPGDAEAEVVAAGNALGDALFAPLRAPGAGRAEHGAGAPRLRDRRGPVADGRGGHAAARLHDQRDGTASRDR